MQPADAPRVGYVVKRYPRYSETFIVNEILAHERAGLPVEIFALRPPVDAHFQDIISQVRAPVHYLAVPHRAADFWATLQETERVLPGCWPGLDTAQGKDVRTVSQGLELARLARLKGITHLHAHFASSATSVARIAGRLAGLPYTFTAHAKDIFHESVEPEDLRRKLRDAAAAITVSEYNRAFLQNTYGPDAAGVVRIYNGLDLDKFPYRAPDRRPPVILSVGRLVEKKGFGDLIAACNVLARQGTMFTCRIIGSGEREEVLRAQIEGLGLAERVHLEGPRPQREVIDRLREAAVFAAPCVIGEDGNRDGLPTVLLEAMALGTPCVSTDVTGIPEVLHHEDTGLMVPQHDPQALATALARLCTDGGLRVRLATAARRLMEKRFDVAHNAAALRRHFRAGAVTKVADLTEVW